MVTKKTEIMGGGIDKIWDLIPRGAIYCINLKRRKDRKRLVQREFERIGLGGGGRRLSHPVTFFEAIESGPLQGCFESHQAVIRLAREKQQTLAVIFEDDVCFGCTEGCTTTWARYVEAIQNYMLPASTPWEILFLGHMPLWGVSAIKGEHPPDIYQTRSVLAHAYIIRTDSQLAENLVRLQYTPHVTLPIDFYYFRHAKALAVYPMVAFQTPSASNNIPTGYSVMSKWALDFFYMNLEFWARVMDFLWWLVRRLRGA